MHANGKIFIKTIGGVTYGVSVADIQQTLGRGTGDVGLLCSDQEWYDNNGTPALRDVNKINKFAKFKPVKSSNKGELTLADRQAAYFGFHTPKLIHPSTPNADTAKWVYAKPTAGAPNEWFRLLDFNGYDHGCACPFRIVIYTYPDGSVLPSEPMYIQCLFDSGVNRVYGDEGSSLRWKGSANLSVSDLLQSTYFSSSYYIAFIIFDATDANHPANLVVTDTTIVSAANGVDLHLLLYPEGNGTQYPAVPILNDSNRYGHDFTVVACFGSGGSGWPVVGQSYKVLTTGFYDLYSLQFEPNVDRCTVELNQAAADISGLVSSVVLQPTSTYETYQGMSWRKFTIQSIILTISTGSWVESSDTVTFVLTLSSDRDRSIIGEHADGYPEPYTLTRSVTLQRNLQNQEVNITNITPYLSVYMWVDEEDAYDYLAVSATATRTGLSPVQLIGGISEMVDYDD